MLLLYLSVSLNLCGQVIPGMEPVVRLASDSEQKLLKSADVWRDVALTSTAFTACAAGVTFIFFVEDMESVLHGQENSDIVVCRYAAAVTLASALFSTAAWTISHQKKLKLPGNCFYIKTSPHGLVVEF